MTNIILYNFSKRENSTKRPSGQGTSVPCLLKSDTSLQNPVFTLQKSIDNLRQYNYLQWSDHYYFINDIISLNNGQTEVRCNEDVLATYKSEIGNYSCVIERSEKINTLLSDSMYIPTNEWESSYAIAERPKNVLHSSFVGNYLLRCVSGAGISTFFITGNSLRDILDFMYTDSNFPDMLIDSFTKFLYDPAKYIVDVKWIPIRQNMFSGSEAEVKLGWFSTGVQALLIGNEANSPTVSFSYKFSLNNPLYDTTDFRYYNSSFSRYIAQLPFIGVVPIDVTKIIDNIFTVTYVFDAFSGLADVYATSGHNSFLHYQIQLSVPINIGGVTENTIGTLTSGVSAISNAFQGNIGGALSAGLQTVQNAMQPDLTMIGSVGNVGGILNNEEGYIQCFACRSTIPDPSSEAFADGETRKISTLNGFVKCRNASVPVGGYAEDRVVINNYLNNGFYYE